MPEGGSDLDERMARFAADVMKLREVALPPSDAEHLVEEREYLTFSGAGAVLIHLHESEGFWDDSSRIDAVEREYQRHCDRLSGRLMGVWGSPARVRVPSNSGLSDTGRSRPLLLQMIAGSVVYVWHFADRSVCIGVSQEDKELPIVLFAGASNRWMPTSP
jgi:hypothetical protein